MADVSVPSTCGAGGEGDVRELLRVETPFGVTQSSFVLETSTNFCFPGSVVKVLGKSTDGRAIVTLCIVVSPVSSSKEGNFMR